MKHPVPDEHLRCIGDITVSFAMLELAIQMLAGSLIAEHQRIGRIITVELSFSNLRSLVISLYKERHGEDEDYATLRDLIKQAGNIEGKRNQITHSVWGAGSDENTLTRVKTTAKQRHGLRFDFDNVTAESLAVFASEIKQLAHEVQILHVALMDKGKAVNNPLEKIW